MYNADRRPQPQALYAPTQHARANIAATPTPRPRRLFSTILETLSWLGEARAVPFVGLNSGSQRDDRRQQNF